MAQHFHLATLEAFVDGAGRTRSHQAFDLDAKFVAQTLSDLEHRGTVRIAYHLHIALTVANIDKNNATMIATTIYPATQADSLTQKGFGHKTAIVGTHGHKQLSMPPP